MLLVLWLPLPLSQPRPQGLLAFQYGGGRKTIRHFENRRREGPGDEVDHSHGLELGLELNS